MILPQPPFHNTMFRFDFFSTTYPPRGGLRFVLWAKVRVHPEQVANSLQDPLTDGSGCPIGCQLHIRSNSGVQYLAQGYFGM